MHHYLNFPNTCSKTHVFLRNLIKEVNDVITVWNHSFQCQNSTLSSFRLPSFFFFLCHENFLKYKVNQKPPDSLPCNRKWKKYSTIWNNNNNNKNLQFHGNKKKKVQLRVPVIRYFICPPLNYYFFQVLFVLLEHISLLKQKFHLRWT